MIEYFQNSQYLQAKKQRKKCLLIYIIIAIVYAVVSIGILLKYTSLPYKSPKLGGIKAIEFVITVIFVLFSFIYMGVPFSRINKYYHLCLNLVTGLKETSTLTFIETDEQLQTKDGVDVKSLVFLEWNKFKKDYYERKVLVLYEMEFPEIPSQATVKVVTQGNVLISYEILKEDE